MTTDITTTPEPHISPQDRFYTAWAIVGELVAVLLTCATARIIGQRIALLSQGGWLPGMGDPKTIAAMTNKASVTIEDLACDNPREKFRVGQTPYYRLDDFAKPDTRKGRHAE